VDNSAGQKNAMWKKHAKNPGLEESTTGSGGPAKEEGKKKRKEAGQGSVSENGEQGVNLGKKQTRGGKIPSGG